MIRTFVSTDPIVVMGDEKDGKMKLKIVHHTYVDAC